MVYYSVCSLSIDQNHQEKEETEDRVPYRWYRWIFVYFGTRSRRGFQTITITSSDNVSTRFTFRWFKSSWLSVSLNSFPSDPLYDESNEQSRVYRIVKNDTVSRAITKGILDGDLLSKFEYLSLDLQTELALNCGTDADTVLANLRNLRVYE